MIDCVGLSDIIYRSRTLSASLNGRCYSGITKILMHFCRYILTLLIMNGNCISIVTPQLHSWNVFLRRKRAEENLKIIKFYSVPCHITWIFSRFDPLLKKSVPGTNSWLNSCRRVKTSLWCDSSMSNYPSFKGATVDFRFHGFD